jgi:hypothetical protein
VFVSNDYLLAHLQRRHAEQSSQLTNGIPGQPMKESRHARESDTMINGELLQELKEIKERLASTERQLHQEKNESQTVVRLLNVTLCQSIQYSYSCASRKKTRRCTG